MDDDLRVVTALQRSLWKVFSIETATSAEEALNAIAGRAYAVVVSDLKMPNMSGIELLAIVKERCPDTVRILLTGYADVDSAIAAVNEGNIFRFLTKPCPQELLISTVKAAMEQYRLIVAEKELLHETLMGTVAALVGVLATIQPSALGRSLRIAEFVRQLAREMKLSAVWEIEIAAMLSQVGSISLNPEVLKKYYAGEKLSESELAHIHSHPRIGCGLIGRIPRLQSVARIIEWQSRPFAGFSDSPPESSLMALGAQMLRVAIDYDRLLVMGMDPIGALEVIRLNDSQYNPDLVAALERVESGATEWKAAADGRGVAAGLGEWGAENKL